MDIFWLGHSCFRIRGKASTVVMDPPAPETGYVLGKIEADIVTVSHQHPGHNNVEGVGGEFKVISGPGEYEVGGVFVTGIASFHDDRSGEVRGKNTIFVVEMEGLNVAHLGDLGHVLSPKAVADIGRVDVLLLPVGGITTIDAVAAAEVMRKLSPRWVVPMHYKTPATARELLAVSKFLGEVGVKDAAPQPRLSVSAAGAQASLQVVLLDYPGARSQAVQAAA